MMTTMNRIECNCNYVPAYSYTLSVFSMSLNKLVPPIIDRAVLPFYFGEYQGVRYIPYIRGPTKKREPVCRDEEELRADAFDQ